MRKPIFCIAVCDDTQVDREIVVERLGEICLNDHINVEISCFESAEELLDSIKEGRQYNMLLLDVMMPGMDGMELARTLRGNEDKVSIVFMSYNREMALQGYEVSAVRYLAKPVDDERLKEAVTFCYGRCQKSEEIMLPVNGGTRKVMPKDIYYIEIIGRKCRIRQEKEEWDTGVSIEDLETMLGSHGFIRCHQSFLVNCRYVRDFRKSSMELMDGRSVPVSKHRLKEVKQAFFDYMSK